MVEETVIDLSEIDPNKLTEFGKEIGYIKTSGKFIPMTNFTVQCTGFVEGEANGEVDGFMLAVKPKKAENANISDQEGVRDCYFLTWKDMSTQIGIMNKLKSNKLWTAPHKDQYLPGYLKALCEVYLQKENKRKIIPVKNIGLQDSFTPDTWVIWENAHVQVVNGRAQLLPPAETPFCNLGGHFKDVLPIFDINNGLDDGSALRKLIELQESVFGSNFPSALLVLGGLGISTHYEYLSNKLRGVPLTLALGEPISQKSTAVECALALFGISNCIGDCTYAGLVDVSKKQTIPFWWDDASNLKVLEQFVLMSFNKADKRTKNQLERNRTVPLVTINPDHITKSRTMNSTKAMRIFTRVAVIPFASQKDEMSLSRRLELEELLFQAKLEAQKSVGVILELKNDYDNIHKDLLFKTVDVMLSKFDIDSRTKMNYALLLYSTGKILSRCNVNLTIDELYADWLETVLLPCYKKLNNPAEQDTMDWHDEAGMDEMAGIFHKLLEKATSHPDVAKKFVIPRQKPRGCLCQEVVAFNVPAAMRFIGAAGKESAIRWWIKSTKMGCNDKKLNFPNMPQATCSHIRRSKITTDILEGLDKAFGNDKKEDNKKIAADNPSEITSESSANESTLQMVAPQKAADNPSESSSGSSPRESTFQLVAPQKAADNPSEITSENSASESTLVAPHKGQPSRMMNECERLKKRSEIDALQDSLSVKINDLPRKRRRTIRKH